MQVEAITERFVYKGNTLSMPTGISEREALKIASGTYPELVNGSVEYNGIIDGAKQYTFTAKIGKKG